MPALLAYSDVMDYNITHTHQKLHQNYVDSSGNGPF